MPVIGPPATGDDFFNRIKELEDIQKILKKNSVLIIAPRRIGKTSLIKKVEQIFGDNGIICLHLDVMGTETPSKFIISLVQNYFKKIDATKKTKFLNHLKGTLKKIEELNFSLTDGINVKFKDVIEEEINEENWEQKGNEIFDAMIKTSENIPSYIIIDELCDCIVNISETNVNVCKKFLKWFRTKRQEASGSLKFLISGSRSIDWVVSEIDPITGYSLLNDLTRFYLDGFNYADAIAFIEKLFIEYEEDYSEELGKKILDYIGSPYIPFFIAVFFSLIQQRVQDKITSEIIDMTYHDDFLGPRGRGYFQYYRNRLKKYGSDFAKAAEKILEKASNADDYSTDLAFGVFKEETGIDEYQKFLGLIANLQNDFYIEADKSRIKFKLKILKEWWQMSNG